MHPVTWVLTNIGFDYLAKLYWSLTSTYVCIYMYRYVHTYIYIYIYIYI